jgi:hypothetical protein
LRPTNGDDHVPLTPSCSPEIEFRHVTTTERRAVAVGTTSHTRPDVDGLVPGRAPGARPTTPPVDIVEEWGVQSFPASDPPPNW